MKINYACRSWLILILAVSPVFSAADDDGDWSQYQPPSSPPNPGETPTTPEGGFSTPERDRLDQWLHSQVLERVCKALKIKKGVSMAGDLSGTGIDVARYLAARADGRLALVEEQRLHVGWGHAFSKSAGDGPSANLWLSGSVSGASIVVRPLKSKEPCKEIDELADLRDIKTVLPFKGERISAMQVGELWRIPFTLSYTQAPSLSEALGGRGAVSVSFGRTNASAASMTVYRLAPNRTRFRFRIDRVVVKSLSAGPSITVPAAQFAIGSENFLLSFVDKELARQFSRRTAAWMSLAAANSDGNRILLEFVIDPEDPSQAEALASALKGDVMKLAKGAWRVTTLQVDNETTRATYEEIRRLNADTLGPPTYAAIDVYDAKTRSFSFNLPFFVAHNASALFGRNKVTPKDGAQTEFRYYRAGDLSSGQYFDVPFVGTIVRNTANRGAEAVTAGVPGESHGEPILVFSRNEDFLRIPSGSVRHSIEEINQVLALAGARLPELPKRDLRLPVDALVPPPLPGQEAKDGSPEWSDRKGVLSLTLVFNQKAVREAAAAPAAAFLEAMAAAADPFSKPLARWLVRNASIKDGQVLYDKDKARWDFGNHPTHDMVEELAILSRQTADLIADIAAVRTAPTNEAKAETLARFVAGKGKSGLSYEQAIKILIQFVDPLDLTGDFVSIVRSTSKGVKSADSHLALKKDRLEVPLLSEAGQSKARFAEPSLMTD